MKTLCLSCFAVCMISYTTHAQDLSALDTVAHYSLVNTTADLTGRHGDMQLTDAPFVGMEGVYSNGIYINDTIPGGSLVITPFIEELYDSVFAVQVEFWIDAFVLTHPVIVCGSGYRYLGFVYDNSGNTYSLLNGTLPQIPDLQVDTGQWYTLTILHDQRTAITEYWLNGQLVETLDDPLLRIETDGMISNTHFGGGWAFNGYLRNLIVFSSGSDISSTQNPAPENILSVYPNPASDVLHFKTSAPGANWLIHDAFGRVIDSGPVAPGNDIDISHYPAGQYMLRVTDGNTSRTARWTKVAGR